jgi:hypothetical protein
MTLRSRLAPLAVTVAVVAVGAGGCIYSSTEKERVVTAPAPPVVATAPAPPVVAQAATDRVVTYPQGRWTLYGDGTTASPHYWVWVPAGASPPAPPPIPRR